MNETAAVIFFVIAVFVILGLSLALCRSEAKREVLECKVSGMEHATAVLKDRNRIKLECVRVHLSAAMELERDYLLNIIEDADSDNEDIEAMTSYIEDHVKVRAPISSVKS